MTTTFIHESLGELHGVPVASVVKFLGIKYASLKDRFARSELIEYDAATTVIDATKLGPAVISPSTEGCDNEFKFIQHTLPRPDMEISELDGLNLNVTVPTLPDEKQQREIRPDRNLPVFVWVHGGGFSVGSNSWPQFDLSAFVTKSALTGWPVIGVAINYRLGLAGFLTSAELREAGYPANNGLRDQINAFRWVKKHIAGFGGDPDNVTFIGESAGSVSGTLHLHSEEALFKRFIAMSGSSLMLKPLLPAVSEFVYAGVLQAFGLEKLTGPERVKALLNVPVEDILKLPPTLPFLPVVDQDLIPEPFTFSQIADPSTQIPGRKWCESLMVGDCQFDGSILGFMIPPPRKVGIAKAFSDSARKTLVAQPTAAENLLEAYGITKNLTDDELALQLVLRFATDIGFFAPALAFAKAWTGHAYLFHFNEPNPWEGPWKGEATHILDVAFLFQNFNAFLSDPQIRVATDFATNVFHFVTTGKPLWPAFKTEEPGAYVFGPSKESTTEFVANYNSGIAEEGSGRKPTILQLGDSIGLDELAAVWGNFLTGQ